jgi:Fe2+ transport system protein FeoA
MMATLFTCPLCGHAFDPAAHLACQTCPLHAGCRLVCCPSCGHTTVDQGQSWIVRRITTFFSRLAPQQDARAPQTMETRTGARALANVSLHGRARVVDVSALPATQREQLRGYGLLPGCVLRVVQRAPVTVVQIEQIELAIETEIAQAIQVDQFL